MEKKAYLVMGVQARSHKQLMKRLEHTGLSAGQPKVLGYLKSHEGRCQKEIAQACQIEPSSLTVQLNRMEKQGMIERRFQNGNNKIRYIYLTEYGRGLAAQVVESFYALEREALADVPEEELEVFFRVCQEIVDKLQRE